MASSGCSDEDQTANHKEEVGPRRGNMPTNCAQRGSIAIIQSSFSKLDSPHFLR